MLTIHERPFSPEDRSEAGHWEGDLIIGKDQRSAIGMMVERKTKMVRLLRDYLPKGTNLVFRTSESSGRRNR